MDVSKFGLVQQIRYEETPATGPLHLGHSRAIWHLPDPFQRVFWLPLAYIPILNDEVLRYDG